MNSTLRADRIVGPNSLVPGVFSGIRPTAECAPTVLLTRGMRFVKMVDLPTRSGEEPLYFTSPESTILLADPGVPMDASSILVPILTHGY